MNSGSSTNRWFAVLALATAALLVTNRLLWRPSVPVGETTSPERGLSGSLPAAPIPTAVAAPSQLPHSEVAIAPAPEPPPATGLDRTNIFSALFDANGEVPRIPEKVVQRWIAAGRTNAADLLAIRQVSGDQKFLLQALSNFPGDPRVLVAATALKDDPGSARARLDQLKRSAPNNSLADYLSAQNHLKNGRPEAALADLVAAAGKTGFDDYSLDANLGAEELYLAAGFSPGEAKAFGTANTLYPHLWPLKDMAGQLAEMEGQHVAAGEVDSAARLAQYGVQLARQLTESGGGKPLIADLTAISILGLTLKPLPPDQRFDFLNGTPAEMLAQQLQLRATLTENSNYLTDWMRAAKESEVVAYFDRWKLYGEAEALRWMRYRMAGNP